MALPKPQAVSVAAICAALTVVSVLAVGYVLLVANSARLEKAVALNEHGYSEAARLELISLIYGPANRLTLDSEERAAALHLLGEISLEDDELSGTLSAWGLLVKEHPDSQLAESVQDKIGEVEADFDQQLSDLKTEVEATLHFTIADRWLEAAGYEAPVVDVSFIPDEEAALDWLGLTIEKFPSTSHAELAYERMIEYRLGKKPPTLPEDLSLEARYPQLRSQRVKSNMEIRRVWANGRAEQSEETLGDFESAFPHSTKLQRLRYLVGQSYWVGGNAEKARQWLSKVIEEDRDENTFWRDLAFRRLQHLEDLYDYGEPED